MVDKILLRLLLMTMAAFPYITHAMTIRHLLQAQKNKIISYAAHNLLK